MRRLITLLCLLLTGCLPAQASVLHHRTVRSVTDAVGVSGQSILRNGTAWVPKGMVILAWTAPAGMDTSQISINAKNQWVAAGAAELSELKTYGADLVRLNVSQCGLDWQRGVLTPTAFNAYVSSVWSAIRLVREAGLSVMLMLQAEAGSGCTDPRLPGTSTVAALQTLAPMMQGDNGIWLEAFNEDNTCVTFASCLVAWAVREQNLVNTIRNLGITNTLVVSAPQSARYLNTPTVGPVPVLHDPQGKIVYAVHPYQNVYQTTADLDTYFGSWCKTNNQACIAAEWHLDSYTSSCGDVTPTSNIPTVANTVVSWLKTNDLGLIGWAWDQQHVINTDYTNLTLTGYDAATIACLRALNPPQGPGQMIQSSWSQ